MTTTTTAAELRATAAAHAQDAADSFERCGTDGALSQWASDLSAQKARLDARIVDDGGTATFPALFTTDGDFVPARPFDGPYGTRWMLLDLNGVRTGKYLSYFPKRRTTLGDKGYAEGYVLRPARADLWAPPGARGMSGTTSVRVIAKATDQPWEKPIEVLTTDRFIEVGAK